MISSVKSQMTLPCRRACSVQSAPQRRSQQFLSGHRGQSRHASTLGFERGIPVIPTGTFLTEEEAFEGKLQQNTFWGHLSTYLLFSFRFQIFLHLFIYLIYIFFVPWFWQGGVHLSFSKGQVLGKWRKKKRKTKNRIKRKKKKKNREGGGVCYQSCFGLILFLL